MHNSQQVKIVVCFSSWLPQWKNTYINIQYIHIQISKNLNPDSLYSKYREERSLPLQFYIEWQNKTLRHNHFSLIMAHFGNKKNKSKEHSNYRLQNSHEFLVYTMNHGSNTTFTLKALGKLLKLQIGNTNTFKPKMTSCCHDNMIHQLPVRVDRGLGNTIALLYSRAPWQQRAALKSINSLLRCLFLVLKNIGLQVNNLAWMKKCYICFLQNIFLSSVCNIYKFTHKVLN